MRNESAESSALPFAPLSTALAATAEEVEWTWQDYVAPGVVTLLGGRPKAGKSTLVCALVSAIAGGDVFLNRPTRAAGVLLLSEERPATLREKGERFALDDRLHLLMSHAARGLPWPEVVAHAAAYCATHNLGVLVVDTLHQWTRLAGDSENAAGAVLEALEPLQALAATGIAVVLVVHQRKSFGQFGEAVRGSNALTGGVDIVVELERGGDTLGDGTRVLRSVSRFAGTPDTLVVALTDDGYESRGTADVAAADAERERLTRLLDELGAATAAELSEASGIPEATARKRLNPLAGENGPLRKTGRGVKGDPVRFHSAHADPLGAESNLSLLDDPDAT